MATTQIEFISVNPGSFLRVHDENRKKIRIQVMKDFRRKERERQGETKLLRALNTRAVQLIDECT